MNNKYGGRVLGQCRAIRVFKRKMQCEKKRDERKIILY